MDDRAIGVGDCPTVDRASEAFHELLFRKGCELESLDVAPTLLQPLHDRIPDARRVDEGPGLPDIAEDAGFGGLPYSWCRSG